MSNDKLAWMELPVSDLTSDNQKLYATLKDAQSKTAKLRADFEAAVRKQAEKMIPADHDLLFSYRFGKVSVATAPKTDKPKASSKNTFKLG